jgi:hypothetical protein
MTLCGLVAGYNLANSFEISKENMTKNKFSQKYLASIPSIDPDR